jgi:hypothetical protein
MAELRRFPFYVIGLALTSAVACGSESSSPGTPNNADGGPGGAAVGGSPPSEGQQSTPPVAVVVQPGDCADGKFHTQKLGTVAFEGKDYEIVIATPCEYVLSHARRGSTYSVQETATHYIVDSHFDLPYLAGVMDGVAFTPGEKNHGWATGMDVEKTVEEIGALPLLYHVMPGNEYGYFTNYDDDLGDIFGAFRPTWRFTKNGDAVTLALFNPPDTAWPRHRGGWNPREINQEIGFGFFVDENGKVYIPKNVQLARKKWDDVPRCVVINRGSAPIPVTRTQFPGDESYYMAETMLPGYASIDSPGHLYWGHKGKVMRDVAKWDDTLPGNFDKPFIWGCSQDGYNIGHAEGFTWPKLREEMRDKYLAGEIAAIPKENLYRVSVWVQKNATASFERKGELFYEWDGDEWLPRAQGNDLITMDAARPTHRISGHLSEGQRAIIVIDDL